MSRLARSWTIWPVTSRPGNTIRRAEELLALSSASPDQQAAAFAAFDELGTALLKPVFDKLNGTLNYDELKILRLCFLSQNG